MNRRFLAIPLLVVPAALFAAQAERLTIRMVPAPNQTLRVRTSMDVTMTMTPDPPAGGAPAMAPITTSMTTIAEHTTTVGPTDEHGHYGARVVCDSASQKTTINGKPAPIPSGMTEQLVGQVITFSYDDQGKMLDVATEGGPDAKFAGSLKQMLTSALAAAPPITLSVGESVTVPTQMNLPIPTPAAGPMTTSGETRYTLTSVTFDGADRIAHLTVVTTNTTILPAASTDVARSAAMDMRTASEGRMDVNVDRGIVLHTETRTKIDGSSHVAGQTVVPPMRTHGTMTMTADLTK
jgi:hypothetical protein